MSMTERAAPPGSDPPAQLPALPLPYVEFIGLMALLICTSALAIDIMLPSLPDIGAALGVAAASDLPLVISSFMVGMSTGQLFWGPLADRIGRRPALLAGLALFAVATFAAIAASSFTLLLMARVAQGFGSAAGRIVVTAVVRDLFAGRQMARVMSTVMTIFVIVPILAPSVGQVIILFGTWRWVFTVLLLVALIGITWAGLRMPETLAPRSAGAPRMTLADGLGLVLGTRVTLGYAIAAGFIFGILVAYIASAQPVFAQAYGLGKLFPVAFGAVACAVAAASFTNSRLVQRIGMRRLSHIALAAHLGISGLLAIVASFVVLPFPVAFGGLAACFFLYGLILSNFNAIAMQPVGRAAGMAASVIGSYTTAAGAFMGTLIARQFDGTILPLIAGFALLSLCALITIIVTEGPSGMFRGE